MDRYFVVQEWMVRDVKLSGLDLLIYAIIFGFSQDDETEFFGSLSYLRDMTGYSKQSIINSLKKLVDTDMLIRKEIFVNGVKTVRYRANFKNFNGGQETLPPSQETLTGAVKKLDQGGQETLPNNKYNINIINNKENKEKTLSEKKKEKKDKIFTPPTLDEVIEYCKSRNSSVDPKVFFDYFDVGHWIDSQGNPVKNWKQKLIMWENHGWGSNDKGTSTQVSGESEGEQQRDFSGFNFYDVY